MEDKEIIDGVDVTGCEYYIQDYQRANNIEGRYEHCKDVCELNGDNYFYCKMNKDCYYKQLKRLQQDYVTLGKAFEHLKTSYQDNCEYVLQLRAENERLNRCMMEALHHEGEKIRETIKYKQTLQEIKEIAESIFIEGDMSNTYRIITDLKKIITKAEEE